MESKRKPRSITEEGGGVATQQLQVRLLLLLLLQLLLLVVLVLLQFAMHCAEHCDGSGDDNGINASPSPFRGIMEMTVGSPATTYVVVTTESTELTIAAVGAAAGVGRRRRCCCCWSSRCWRPRSDAAVAAATPSLNAVGTGIASNAPVAVVYSGLMRSLSSSMIATSAEAVAPSTAPSVGCWSSSVNVLCGVRRECHARTPAAAAPHGAVVLAAAAAVVVVCCPRCSCLLVLDSLTTRLSQIGSRNDSVMTPGSNTSSCEPDISGCEGVTSEGPERKMSRCCLCRWDVC